MRLLFLLLVCTTTARANNITVTNVTLTGQNTGAETSVIQFDLSWENSWRISSGPANYDAAWVFAKFRVGGGAWQHAVLNGVGTAPAGGSIDLYDAQGAMVYRSADGSGDVSFTSAQLIWDYGASGVGENDVVDVQVFAIEMVYVPEGEFFLGTGRPFGADALGEEANEFHTRRRGGFGVVLIDPYRVTSENAITISPTLGDLYYFNDQGTSGDQTGSVSAAFPKGFGAFYSMKYEVSEGQYVAYFNTLTESQKVNMDITGSQGKATDNVVNRNTIAWDDSGNATTSSPDQALNYVPMAISLSYLDWSGLRPMTELEFEKAQRGPVNPTAEEYAWGTSNLYATQYTYANEMQANEIVTNPGVGTGNALYGGTDFNGPLRCGIFAASAVNASREETGGSYYGIMELSGNVYERMVTVGSPAGRRFSGNHGDGTVNSSSGFPNVSNWPNATTGAGIGFRGGAYSTLSDRLRVSDRFDGATDIGFGNSRLGFRGVRTAQ